MRVRDFMQTKIITVSSNTLVPEAERIMRDHNTRRLPVVDQGSLVGLVTQKALLKLKPSSVSYTGAFETQYIIGNMLVKDIMVKARDLVTVTPDTTIEDAVFLGQEYQIGVLPVIDKEKLVGIITETDLFKLTMQVLGFGKGRVQLHIFGYPAGRCLRNVIFIILSNNVRIQRLFQVTLPATGEEDTIIQLDTTDAADIVDQLRTRGYVVETRSSRNLLKSNLNERRHVNV